MTTKIPLQDSAGFVGDQLGDLLFAAPALLCGDRLGRTYEVLDLVLTQLLEPIGFWALHSTEEPILPKDAFDYIIQALASDDEVRLIEILHGPVVVPIWVDREPERISIHGPSARGNPGELHSGGLKVLVRAVTIQVQRFANH